MAVSTAVSPRPSYFQNFSEGLRYALFHLQMSHLKNKNKQCVPSTMETMFSFTGFGKSVCFQALPFLFDHKLRLFGDECRYRGVSTHCSDG